MPRIGSRSGILVFAKAPQAGAAKTRLIPLLGADEAAALHARLVEHTLAMAAAAAGAGALQLHGAPSDDPFLQGCATRHGATLVQQSTGNLGQRMHHAFERALDHDGCSGAVLIGSDCPALTPEHLRLAVRALDQGHDAVFAPAEDGGYVLVGLARPDWRIFEGVEWSTGRVMQQTRDRLRELNWRWLEIETLWDVDHPADYERLVTSGLLTSDWSPRR